MTNQGETHPFSEAHYRLAMEAAGVGLWDWDLIQQKQTWTDQCKAFFGLDAEEDVSYERFLSFVHPNDRECVACQIAESLRDRIECNIEYRIIWPDGSLHWLQARGRGCYDEQGVAVRMIGVAFDVTSRKEAEEVQRRADQRVRDILESVQEAFTHLDRNWRFTYVNSRATLIGGYIPEAEILGRKFWDVYPILIGTDTDHYFHQVMQTRKPASYEIHYPEIQSWYDIRVYPADDGGITIFLTDITERKELEEERDRLLEQERAARIEAEDARQRSDALLVQLEHRWAFLQAIMQQAPSGLIIAEAPLGNIILASAEAARLLGQQRLEAESYRAYAGHKALHSDGTRYLAEEYPLARALLTGEVIKQEDMLYQRADGSPGHLAISAAPIYDARGNILAAVATFNDISERYELERKKDEFIVMASHELRTPLTSIKGNLQLVQRRLQRLLESNGQTFITEGKPAAESVMQWNERALRQVNVEGRLINDLLDASRIQTRGLYVSLEPGNLLQMVRDAVSDMQANEPERTILLELPQAAEVLVKADSVRINQIITNYLSNALKFSPENQPVTVGLTLTGDEARAWVKDAGPGLSPEALDYIWDRFHQVGSFVDYTRLGRGGLGLGLYINQALVQLHGGRSGVESTAGKGSTFWFTLPLSNS